MKRAFALLLAALLCLTGCASAENRISRFGEALRSFLTGNRRFTVGTDIVPEEITDFHYTYATSTYPPHYQRYRFYAEDGAYYFYHEQREGDHWPLTDEDVTVSGTIALSEAQWAQCVAFLNGGAVKAREESLEDGDAGPWLYLYWKNDRSRYQEFSFASWDDEIAFEEFCAALKAGTACFPEDPDAE